MRYLNQHDRFDKNLAATPFSSGGARPIPTRNIYALFGDGGQDLFKHGLSELTPMQPWDGSRTRLNQFRSTADYSPDGEDFGPAKEDPVMFGFDLIIRKEESPLFSTTMQDSVFNFLTSGICTDKEILSRQEVWESFKTGFFQFFRSSLETQPIGPPSDPDNPANSRFYYYLTKVTGLDSLVESNSGETIKSFVDYGKDIIKLDFTEDVTLRIGRMAALYKSLYWSRMSGKNIIPENLLRFDCDIIVSEVRNFVKIKRVYDSQEELLGPSGIQTLRDNVNRYVYTLYDCQLFFDKMPHGDVVDLATQPDIFAGYSIGFTFKHSTMRVDVFNPSATAYSVINNGSYNPAAVTSFDRFLNQVVPISATDSTIADISIDTVPQLIIDVIKLDGSSDYTSITNPLEQEKVNAQMHNSITYGKNYINEEEISQMEDAGQGISALSDYRWGYPNEKISNRRPKDSGGLYDFYSNGRPISTHETANDIVKNFTNPLRSKEDKPNHLVDSNHQMNTGFGLFATSPSSLIEMPYSAVDRQNTVIPKKKELLDNEENFYKGASYSIPNKTIPKKNELFDDEKKFYESSRSDSWGKTTPSNNIPNKTIPGNEKILNSELESAKSRAPKDSWLNSDSPGARFAKRIANVGIAAINQTIAKRIGILNKALYSVVGNSVTDYKALSDPKNIYQSDFNGEQYLGSKYVKDAFRNFVGESVSSLFKR
jgi:hypothetical protein